MRIATDHRFVRGDVPLLPLLQPLVDPGTSDDRTSWTQRFAVYAERAPTLHQLVDIDEAEVVVVPVDWYWVRGPSWASRPNRRLREQCQAVIEWAAEAGVPSVAFFSGDRSCDRVEPSPDIVFREGAYSTRFGTADRAMPAFVEDLVEHHLAGELPIREKRPVPTIGFCGLASRRTGPNVRMRELAFHLVTLSRQRRLEPPPFTGENMRASVLEIFRRHTGCETNFLVRDHSVFFRDADPYSLVEVRQEYVENLVNSDYTLCVRGSGNYSYRLYESICMGRIPIIVNSDLVLPSPADIDWRRHSIWIEPSQLSDIGDIVAAEHERMSADEFAQRQADLRELWLGKLSPAAWLGELSTHLDPH